MARKLRSEKGYASIEMIGIIPIAMLVAGVIIQVFLVGYAAVSAESAARLAAREASQGSSPSLAADHAEASVSSFFDTAVDFDPAVSDADEPGVTTVSDGDQSTARSQVTVPFLGIGVENLDITLTRYATMPNTD